jgi:hypothetical protein
VVDRVDPAQQVRHQVAVAGVALVEVGAGTEVAGPAAAVHGRGQRVEHDDVVAAREQPVAGVRADEPGAPGDEDPHVRWYLRCSATSR